MNLGELLFSLSPLLKAPKENAAQIAALLAKNSHLAEMEVARIYVSQKFAPVLLEQARSVDPRQRRQAATSAALVLGRSAAARVLRRLVKDADTLVRHAARASARRLGLEDVALPDTRFKPPRFRGPLSLGGWNITGWSFGLFRFFQNRGGGPRTHPQLPRTGKKKRPDISPALPSIPTPKALASFLGLTSIREIAKWQRPGEEKGSGYVAFEVPKRSGGTRRIHAPKAALKKAQRTILDLILALVPTHGACHGFVKGRSITTNAGPHEGKRLVLKVDLSDFFPTIHFRRVVGLFEMFGYSPEVATLLASLCTHRARLPDGHVVWPGVLPQGAPTSPAIANIICRRLDARLSQLANKVGAHYTRYADDLTFSFADPKDVHLGRFFWWVDQICQAEGFTENAKKRRILKQNTQQRVAGVVVNHGLHVPRTVRRNLRAMLHQATQSHHGASVTNAVSPSKEVKTPLQAIMGQAAYVNMVEPKRGQVFLAALRALKNSSNETPG